MVSQVDIDPQEFYRTNDMAQATFLKVKGHAVQRVAWEGSTCYWVFRVTDNLLDLSEDYLEGTALVDPREYNRIFSMTKREFYDSAPDGALTRRSHA